MDGEREGGFQSNPLSTIGKGFEWIHRASQPFSGFQSGANSFASPDNYQNRATVCIVAEKWRIEVGG